MPGSDGGKLTLKDGACEVISRLIGTLVQKMSVSATYFPKRNPHEAGCQSRGELETGSLSQITAGRQKSCDGKQIFIQTITSHRIWRASIRAGASLEAAKKKAPPSRRGEVLPDWLSGLGSSPEIRGTMTGLARRQSSRKVNALEIGTLPQKN